MADPLWEQRWHPFRGEWVLYTAHRAARPWLGDTHVPDRPVVASFDPTCALCPGNERVGGARNPRYTSVHWFTNDLPPFGSPPRPDSDADLIRRHRAATGTAEVVCFHPEHHRSFADLDPHGATEVVTVWAERTAALGARTDVDHVLVFENRGALVGTSNPHPHNQIYAGNLVYGTTDREHQVALEYHRTHGRPIGIDVLDRELRDDRVVAETDHFVAVVPWFARLAFEVIVLPRRPVARLDQLSGDEHRDLAAIMQAVVRAYDALWDQELPYVLAVHQAACDGRPTDGYPFHLEYHPPLRAPDTLKYLAGPEVGGGTMTNESDPDVTAALLRGQR